MKDVNDIIKHVMNASGKDEKTVEKLVRSMFTDIQDFTNEKRGVCIQIPYVGTFRFRVNAIPNYVIREKTSLSYWIGRLFLGQRRQLVKTINIATDNIQMRFFRLRKVSDIKNEYITKHAKYRPRLKEYLENDTDSDIGRLDAYVNNVASEILIQETSPFPPTVVQKLPSRGIL